MGLFQNLLGKGKNRWGACGRSIDSLAPAVRVITFTPGGEEWNLEGCGYHCDGCNMDLCDKHWEFQKEPPGRYVLSCNRCNTPLGGPAPW